MPADELWESLWADSAAEESPAAVEPLECDSLAVNISAATQRFPSNYVRERFDVSESLLLCSPCRPAGIDEQFSAAEPRSSADSGKRRRIEPQLQRPFSDDVDDDDFNLSGSSDSNSSDSNSSGSDDEAVTGPTFVEDGEFDAVHAESLKNSSRNAAKLQRAERALDDEHDAKLAADACRAAANFSCNCYVDCSLRANVNAGLIQELRRDTLREPLKCGRRTTYIAQLIYATKTATPTYMHMDEGNIRRRSDGTNVRMSQIHFVVNGMDVCSDFFCEARGLSKNLVEKAFGMANAGDMRLPKRQRSRKAFQRRLRADTGIDDSYQVAAAVEWILRHAVENGAEFMPTAHFDGRSTAEAQSARATTNQVEAALLNTSQVRLHERKVNELHRKYVEASRGLHSSVGLGVDSDPSPGGFRFVPLSYARFCKVFKEHKKLKHLRVARKNENFAKCNCCHELTYIMSRTGGANREARAVAKQKWTLHIIKEAENRNGYIRRTHEAVVDYEEMVISGALSFVIDKPTKQATHLPAMAQLPKFLSVRLPYPVIGVIAHGVGPFVAGVPPAQSDGVNATCEMIYLVIVEIQKKFKTPRKMHLQADNHTDNKTPVFVCFVAWLIAEDVVDEATINFLSPGHGHMDLDQLFSKWIRSILDPYNRSVTRARLMQSIKSSQRRTTAPTTEVPMLGVRDWAAFFAHAVEDVGLRRIAMSVTSDESIYQYILKKDANGTIVFFYKRRAVDDEVYPRSHQRGQKTVIHGARVTVVDSIFNPTTQLWDYTAKTETDECIIFSYPPVGIPIFAGDSGVPAGMPVFEGVLNKYDEDFVSIERSLLKCCRELSAVRDTPGAVEDWEGFLLEENRRLSLCKLDGGAYFRGEAPPPLKAGLPHVDIPVEPLPDHVPFTIDPVVFKPVGGSSGLSDAQRAAFAKSLKRREQRKIVHGGLVALQLRVGTNYPRSHVAPFCLGFVPSGYLDTGMPMFPVLFSEAKGGKEALTGTWLAASSNQAQLQMPLSSVLCSGLELEPLPEGIEPESMSVDALKAELKCRGLQCTGQKSALSSRLAMSVSETGAVPLYRGRRLKTESVALLRDVCRPYDLGL